MELNLKQKKILKLLSINCRFSNKDIGKSAGMSEDAVAYQIDKLLNHEKIAEFNVQFFYPMIDYTSYHVWVRLKSGKIEEVKKINEVHSINSSHGKYDFQILVFAKSKRNFIEVLKKIKSNVSIQKIAHSKLVGIYKSFSNIIPQIDVSVKIPKNSKRFEYALDNEKYPLPSLDKKIKLDAVDNKIINELMKNPRASFQKLAEATGLNHETIRYRMRKFVKENFITNFGLIHDFSKYGSYVNYFLIDLNKKKLDRKKFEEFLNSTRNIFYCAELEGKYNCIVYISTKDPKELGEIYGKFREVLGDSIKEIDMLFMDKILKYEQFPKEIL